MRRSEIAPAQTPCPVKAPSAPLVGEGERGYRAGGKAGAATAAAGGEAELGVLAETADLEGEKTIGTGRDAAAATGAAGDLDGGMKLLHAGTFRRGRRSLMRRKGLSNRGRQ